MMIYVIKWNLELLRCWQIEPHHTGKFSLRKSRGSRWGAKFSGGSGFQNKHENGPNEYQNDDNEKQRTVIVGDQKRR